MSSGPAKCKMRIVLLTHPGFQASQSMPRFAAMLRDGMRQRGHEVEVMKAEPIFFRLPFKKALKKWLGYVDQLLIFPIYLNWRLKGLPPSTLFVFADQALGPWVPWLAGKPHVIHCHDFLAQKAALGLIPEAVTGRTGQWYQALIRRGYRKGRHFISVSRKTQEDLESYLREKPLTSEVVYNGLNKSISRRPAIVAREELSRIAGCPLGAGYILHVGANQWYKNRIGVVEIYNAWRKFSQRSLPLLLVGPHASETLRRACEASPFREDIHLLEGLDDDTVLAAYAGAGVFLFPSLAEGFGWPIAEAMASGCPVITTGEAPMTEVAGNAAWYIPRRPSEAVDVEAWTVKCAGVLDSALDLDPSEREEIIGLGLANAARFETEKALDAIEEIYQKVLVGGAMQRSEFK